MSTKPCVECGTTGGYIPVTFKKPARPKGLCWNCYYRNYKRAKAAQRRQA